MDGIPGRVCFASAHYPVNGAPGLAATVAPAPSIGRAIVVRRAFGHGLLHATEARLPVDIRLGGLKIGPPRDFNDETLKQGIRRRLLCFVLACDPPLGIDKNI